MSLPPNRAISRTRSQRRCDAALIADIKRHRQGSEIETERMKQWTRVANLTAIAVTTSVLSGCIYPPGMQTVVPDRAGYVSPDDFRVDSNAYPTYRVARRIDAPPSAYFGTVRYSYLLAPIETSDIWRVTHRVEDRFLIYSEDYQKRQCELLQRTAIGIDRGGKGLFDRRCIPQRLFEIFIFEDGTVAGGWQVLKNPERVILASDRRTRFNDTQNREDWGAQPLFVQITAPNDRVQSTP